MSKQDKIKLKKCSICSYSWDFDVCHDCYMSKYCICRGVVNKYMSNHEIVRVSERYYVIPKSYEAKVHMLWDSSFECERLY